MREYEYECNICHQEFGLGYDEEAPDFDDDDEPVCWACAIKRRDTKISELQKKLAASEETEKKLAASIITSAITSKVDDMSKHEPKSLVYDKLICLLNQVLDKPCNKRHHDLAREIVNMPEYSSSTKV